MSYNGAGERSERRRGRKRGKQRSLLCTRTYKLIPTLFNLQLQSHILQDENAQNVSLGSLLSQK